MKSLLIILVTFIVALASSALLDLDFFARSWVRTGLVVLFICVVLVLGYTILKDVSRSKS